MQKKSKLLIKALFLDKQNLKRYSMYTGHRLDLKKKGNHFFIP